MVTGLQKEFSWAGVAAAGAGGAAFKLAGDAFNARPLYGDGAELSSRNLAANLGRSMASTLANAATRSLIEGANFGDNVMAALPNVIGQTIGESIAGALSGRAFKDIRSIEGFEEADRSTLRSANAMLEALQSEHGISRAQALALAAESQSARSSLLALVHRRPAFCAYMKAALASGRMRAIICVACALAAVPSRTRPAMPCRMPARRKAL